MNMKRLTSIICGSAISLAGASLLAQQSSTTDPSSTSSSSSSPNQGTAAGNYGSSSAYNSREHWMTSGQSVRLSDLMNATVQSQDGKTVGYIRDFTVHPRSGHIEFAILSPSQSGSTANMTSTSSSQSVLNERTSNTSTLGANDKLIPVPWQLFSRLGQNGQSSSTTGTAGTSTLAGHQPLVLNIDSAKLQSAPSFAANSWSDLQQSSFDQRVYSYFGVSRMTGAGTSGASPYGTGTSSSSSTPNSGSSSGTRNDTSNPPPK
jgi:sporulation protein YlmC with PRC-barrel domain